MAAVISPPISQHRLHALLPSVHKRGARRAQELQGPGSGTKFWGVLRPYSAGSGLVAPGPAPRAQGPAPTCARSRPAPLPPRLRPGPSGATCWGPAEPLPGPPPGPFPAPAGASPQRLGAGGQKLGGDRAFSRGLTLGICLRGPLFGAAEAAGVETVRVCCPQWGPGCS